MREGREAVLGHDERVALSDYTQERVVVVVVSETNGCEYIQLNMCKCVRARVSIYINI